MILRYQLGWKRVIGTALLLLGVVGVILYSVKTPQHDREWQSYQTIMPQAEVSETEVVLQQVRDWQHSTTTTYDHSYLDSVTIAQDDIAQVWFTIQPFAAVDAIGHTMLTFELKNGEAYTFSIEARREVGEEYIAWRGLFREYELLYTWGTARDFLGVRLFFLRDDLYHYPVQLTPDKAWLLFRHLATATNELYGTPQFYNTATANCTNLIAEIINDHSATRQLPYGLAWNLPGLGDQYLQRHGYLESSLDFAAIRSQSGLQQFSDELQVASMESNQAFARTLRTVSYEVLEDKSAPRD